MGRRTGRSCREAERSSSDQSPHRVRQCGPCKNAVDFTQVSRVEPHGLNLLRRTL